ncbi:MAG: DUF3467 domain-containing protein [Pirellulales bacterium]|nr:DUF3467 domain-containing protein [Pirellulales bacterium]
MTEPNNPTNDTPPTPVDSAPPTEAAQRRPQLRVDETKAHVAYANFCRVTGTPEEMILDFGLNPQPFGVPTEPIPINQRLIVNFFTAKRMLHALQLTIQRQETAFGVLETDVQKRVLPGAFRPVIPQPQPQPNA